MVDTESKDEAAVALGRKGGKKGGKARAAKLSKKDLSAQGRKAAKARWALPKATHDGDLRVGDISIPCFVLEDGKRVISQRGMATGLALSAHSGAQLPRFTSSASIKPYVSDDLVAVLNSPIKFRTGKGGGVAFGYEATMLSDLCEAVLGARDAGALKRSQVRIAKHCDILVRAFARLGIIALVDEATGYQYDRARNALAEILEKFIARELARWARTFPEEFYRELYRLHPKLDPARLGAQKAQWIGNVTNNIVYDRLAPGVRAELERKNPRKDGGNRSARHHQWLTRQTGYPKLMLHLGHVIGLMNESDAWDDFMEKLDRRLPRQNANLRLPFPEKPR